MRDLRVLDLLALFGFDRSSRAKYVRHHDRYGVVQEMLRRNWIEAYQAFQARRVFDNLDYLLSFVGDDGNRARFIGVFKIAGRRSADRSLIPDGCAHLDWVRPKHYFYNLAKQAGFEALENRLVIQWGPAALAWHQNAGKNNNKVVERILPTGQLIEIFEDYLSFTLTHSELKYLFDHAEKNGEWRARLSSVAGVYLILDSRTGRQYIGSAYGEGGIWSRWSCYADDGHGGNVGLKHLVRTNRAYPSAFTYSILQVLPYTSPRADVIACEQRYKRKLGSLASGLNSN